MECSTLVFSLQLVSGSYLGQSSIKERTYVRGPRPGAGGSRSIMSWIIVYYYMIMYMYEALRKLITFGLASLSS